MAGCLLLDGNNIIFRAYYALERQNLKTRAGKSSGAVFGFLRMLLKLLRESSPDFVAVAFDVSKDTFRRKIYPEYKAQRRPTPPDLLEQLPVAHQLVELFGIKTLRNPEYEADDLIGSSASVCKKETSVTIVTGDRDLLQLIDERVIVKLCAKGISELMDYDTNLFVTNYGFPPEGIIDLKALMGDASDNIPGVDGIGEKKAMALIKEFGTIDNLYNNMENVTNPRMKQQLTTGRESAVLSRMLATIKCDIPVISRPEDLSWKGLASAEANIRNFCTEWNFTSILQEIGRNLEPQRSTKDTKGEEDQKLGPQKGTKDTKGDEDQKLGPQKGTKDTKRDEDQKLEPQRGTKDTKGDEDQKLGPQKGTKDTKGDEDQKLEPQRSTKDTKGDEEQGTADCREETLIVGDEFAPPAAEIVAVELKQVPGEFLSVTNVDDLEKYLDEIGETICLDVETTGLDPFRNQIVGFSFSGNPGRAVYVPVRHSYLGLSEGEQLSPESAFPILKKKLDGKTLIGHNLKFDLAFLAKEGVTHSGPMFDTMLAAYVLDPTTPNGLKPLSRTLLGMDAIEYHQTARSRTFTEVPIGEATPYACQDVILPLLLLPRFRRELKERNLEDIFYKLEMPILPLLLEMETLGIGINRDYLSKLSSDLGERMRELEKSIHTHAGVSFNVNSGKQLQEILFTKLGLTPPRKTKTGFSTDAEVLRTLTALHPIIRELLEYREIAKLKTTYVDSLQTLVHPRTGLVHTSFNQTVTATGRLSSSNPNLQNIPIKTELGRKVRRVFVPPRKGDRFLSLDYSQIELRLLAHFSKDPDILRAYQNNIDIHALTASKLFGKPPEQIDSSERKIGKTVNFGIIYGISAHALSEDLGVTRPVAQKYIDGFFSTFPDVTEFFKSNLARAKETGQVSTILGRLRPLPELSSKSFQTRAFGERVARNTPLQGSAADLVKKAMLDADKLLKKGKFATRLVLQIHDELVFSCPPSEIGEVSVLLKDCMEKALSLNVPLVCDVASGPNLADLNE